MKILILSLLLLPACLLANDAGKRPVPDQERQAELYSRAVRNCMQQADQVELMMLQMRAAVMAAEVSGLCATGQKQEAQALARRRVRELEVDPLVRELRACSGLANQRIPADTDFCEIELQSLPIFR